MKNKFEQWLDNFWYIPWILLGCAAVVVGFFIFNAGDKL